MGSNQRGASRNKSKVKIEQYDDAWVPSSNENALQPFVQCLLGRNRRSGVVMPKEEGGASSSGSNLRSYFIGMGFSSALVERVLQDKGDDDANIILETLLKSSASEEQATSSSLGLGELFSSDSDEEVHVSSGSSASNCYLNSKISMVNTDGRSCLLSMNFSDQEVDLALNHLGKEASIEELVDSIVTLQVPRGACTDLGLIEESSAQKMYSDAEKTLHLLGMGFTESEVNSSVDNFGLEVSVEVLAHWIVARREVGGVSSTKEVKHLLCSESKIAHIFKNYVWPVSNSSLVLQSDTNNACEKWLLPVVELARQMLKACFELLNPLMPFLLMHQHVFRGSSSVKMATDLSTRRGKRSSNTLTSNAGSYYAKQNNEGRTQHFKRSKNIPLEKKNLSNQEKHSGSKTPTTSSVNNEMHRTSALLDLPYFIFGSVAELSEKAWLLYSQFLHNLLPEFVNSQLFSALKQKEGYLHNLPVETRQPIESRTIISITDVLPFTKKWWPHWDKRRQLNSMIEADKIAQTCEELERTMNRSHGVLPPHDQNSILQKCDQLNLIWVGKNKLAPLEPDQLEKVLGYSINHTHLADRTLSQRLKTMKHSFQTDTIGYILSPLKDLYPDGLRVLSLYTGIGGAEIALTRLGLHLKCVVSVENSDVHREIFKRWWEHSGQTGELRQICEISKLKFDQLAMFVREFGGFDLIVGAHFPETWIGVVPFFEFLRVVKLLNSIMRNIHWLE